MKKKKQSNIISAVVNLLASNFNPGKERMKTGGRTHSGSWNPYNFWLTVF